MATNSAIDFDFSLPHTLDKYEEFIGQLKRHYPHGTAMKVTSDHPEIVAKPYNTVAPAITGTIQDGQTATCSSGTWLGSPTYTYQWYLDGDAIVGEITNEYVIVTGDVGSVLTCIVTATNRFGATTQVSNTTAAVLA